MDLSLVFLVSGASYEASYEAAFVSVVSNWFFSVVLVPDAKEALYEAPLNRKTRLNCPIPFFGFTGAFGQG